MSDVNINDQIRDIVERKIARQLAASGRKINYASLMGMANLHNNQYPVISWDVRSSVLSYLHVHKITGQT